jgi:hypothetical protein
LHGQVSIEALDLSRHGVAAATAGYGTRGVGERASDLKRSLAHIVKGTIASRCGSDLLFTMA